MAVTCATAILMLAGSATTGFADDGLWGAVAHYHYFWPADRGEYAGYGVAVNAPSMADALARAVKQCNQEEQKVPAYVREDPEALFDLRANRCDGTNWYGPGKASNRRVFSTSVPQPPGHILDALPEVQALHARCVVMSLHWNANYPNSPKSFGHSFTNDPTAVDEELLAQVEGHPEIRTQIESVNCNDR